jgi:hypothetical protein
VKAFLRKSGPPYGRGVETDCNDDELPADLRHPNAAFFVTD